MKKFFSLIIATFCTLLVVAQESIPAHETFKIFSKTPNEERTINVWLPPNFDKNAQALPVLYMLDGGIEEDFVHVAQTVEKLVKSGSIKPIILVGIENTQRKRDLTGYTESKEGKKIAPEVGGSRDFRAFILLELFPEMNVRYNTLFSKRALMGESLAGLFVVETFLYLPYVFDIYIAFDPSLWWNSGILTREAPEILKQIPPDAKRRVWLAASDTQEIAPYVKTLSQQIKDIASHKIDHQFVDAPNESHGTIFKATKEQALIWAFN